jgi:hypothetical protein
MINDKLLNIQYGSGSLSFYKKDWLLPAAETTDMGFNFPLTAEHAERYTRIIEEGAAVSRHYDLLIWLQGEIQYYLPHEIMLAAWGDFDSGYVRYDIATVAPGTLQSLGNAGQNALYHRRRRISIPA